MLLNKHIGKVLPINYKPPHNPEIFPSDFFGIIINAECDGLGIIKNVSHQISRFIRQVFFLLAFPTYLWRINPLNPNRDIVAEEVIGPVIIKG